MFYFCREHKTHPNRTTEEIKVMQNWDLKLKFITAIFLESDGAGDPSRHVLCLRLCLGRRVMKFQFNVTRFRFYPEFGINVPLLK